MFAVSYGANQFVPLLAVCRRTLELSEAQATAIFCVLRCIGGSDPLSPAIRMSDERGNQSGTISSRLGRWVGRQE